MTNSGMPATIKPLPIADTTVTGSSVDGSKLVGFDTTTHEPAQDKSEAVELVPVMVRTPLQAKDCMAELGYLPYLGGLVLSREKRGFFRLLELVGLFGVR